MVSLSVVTVVRDDVDGFRATMATIAAQSVAPDEVVVIDGSVDRAAIPGVLTAYPSVRSSYTWSPPTGVYGAMNTGLAQATGDYVYFLNAGDLFASDTVLEVVKRALDDGHPLWAIGRVEFRDEEGAVLPEPDWTYADERRHLFARGRFPAHQGVIACSSALRDVGGFDPRYVVAADYAAVLRLASREDPLELGIVLAVFTTGGLSTQRWRTALTEFHRARVEAFRPSGGDAIAERAWTARTRVASEAYRLLWAPGRPLAGIVARGRSRLAG